MTAFFAGMGRTVPEWYATALAAERLGIPPWELEHAIARTPGADWWVARLRAAWQLEADARPKERPR